MPSKDYELLVNYIEEMISDDLQLIHGGQLVGWKDTKIPELLQNIRNNQEDPKIELLEPGDLLKNKYTGQKVAVIYEDNGNVHLNPLEKVLIYPKDQIWQHFERSNPGG